MSNSVQPYGLWPARLLCPWDSPSKNTGVGCHALLQGIVLIQGLNRASHVSCIAGRIFSTGPTWEALVLEYVCKYQIMVKRH